MEWMDVKEIVVREEKDLNRLELALNELFNEFFSGAWDKLTYHEGTMRDEWCLEAGKDDVKIAKCVVAVKDFENSDVDERYTDLVMELGSRFEERYRDILEQRLREFMHIAGYKVRNIEFLEEYNIVVEAEKNGKPVEISMGEPVEYFSSHYIDYYYPNFSAIAEIFKRAEEEQLEEIE